MHSVSNSMSGGNAQTIVQAQYATLVQQAQVRPSCIPRMQPAPPDGFVDRELIRARLDALTDGLGARTSAQVVVITGAPGVGKSGVVLYWVAERSADFPGGVFYVDMSPRGELHPSDTAGVLEAFIGLLGIPRDELPAGVLALGSYFRSLTSHAPCLVVLDGVVNAAQVPPLLPGHPASLVLVTSRQLLGRLRAALPSRPVYVPVDGLDDAACAELFRYAADATGAEQPGDGELLRAVIPAFGGLPLAARIAGARAADPLDGGLDALARQLTGRRSLLEALAMPDEPSADDAAFEVTAVFEVSYRALDAPAARVFRALGLNPTPEFADELVDALAGGAEQGARIRRTLLDGSLLERRLQGRCRMNRLVHEYARELAQSAPTPDGGVDEATEVGSTLAAWYLWRAAAAEHLVSKRWRIGAVFTEPDLLSEVFSSEEEALDAVEADRENAVAVAGLALRAQRYGQVCELVEALRGVFFRRKHHTLWVEVCGLGVEAATRRLELPTPPADALLVSARMHYELAFAHFDQGGDPVAAARHYEAAREAARRARHARTESTALEGLGLVALAQDRPEAAADLFGQAIDALGDLDHARGRALLTYHRGRAASAAGHHEEAAGLLVAARRQFADLPTPDRYNEARTLTRHAESALAAGHPDQAVTLLTEALDLFQGRGAPKEEADARLLRGDAHVAQSATEEAREDWQMALNAYTGIGSLRAAEARARLAGPERRGGAGT
ncbi:hypothetical protein [Streptomyces apocyni]|uniref:hypothetical protein n=1 Tax=Streptomyces apocyni TaxID=2654677 RepID=UPI0012E9A0F2|nr:hypothetical protein [Streptomyces apocyni]